MKIAFQLNGNPVEASVHPGLNLLEYLRSAGLFSVKFGCDGGECGSCAVLINAKARNACLVLMYMVEGQAVETLEGLNHHDRLTDIQKKFIDSGAIQCGYCTPGMLISLEALIRENPDPDEARIRETLASNLCRCTGYVKPVKAVIP